MAIPTLAHLLLAAVLVAAGEARAEGGIDAARDAYLAGDYPEAARLLARTERAPGISDDIRGRIHWYRALLHLAEGNTAAATQSLDALLAATPLFEADPREAPPTTRALLLERSRLHTRDRAPQLGTPTLEASSLTVPVAVRAEPVAHVVVLARAPGDAAFSRAVLPVDGGQARGSLDALDCWKAARAAGSVEVALEAQRANGTPLARLGTLAQPLSLAVNVPAEPAPAAPAVEKRAAPSRPVVAPALTLVAGGLGGASLAVAVLAAGVFLSTGAVLLAQPTPRRQPWWPAALLAYQSAFWVAVLAAGLSVLPLGGAVVSGVAWAVAATRAD